MSRLISWLFSFFTPTVSERRVSGAEKRERGQAVPSGEAEKGSEGSADGRTRTERGGAKKRTSRRAEANERSEEASDEARAERTEKRAKKTRIKVVSCEGEERSFKRRERVFKRRGERLQAETREDRARTDATRSTRTERRSEGLGEAPERSDGEKRPEANERTERQNLSDLAMGKSRL